MVNKTMSSIGLKNILRMVKSILQNYMSMLRSRVCKISLSFVRLLIQQTTMNGLRHARGPVRSNPLHRDWVAYLNCFFSFLSFCTLPFLVLCLPLSLFVPPFENSPSKLSSIDTKSPSLSRLDLNWLELRPASMSDVSWN